MTPIASAKLAGIVGVLLFAGWVGRQTMAGENAALRIKHAQTLQSLAEKASKAAELAVKASEAYRQREQEQAQRFVDLSTKHHRKLRDAQAKADAVVADLRAGNVRLRGEWADCVSRTPEAGPGASGADDAADVLPAGVGRVLGIVGACQAHVESLQAVLIAERHP